MRKDLGVVPAVYPMPVLMVAAYDENRVVNADEKVLADNGKVASLKLNALIFDKFQSGYYVSTEKVGQAWNAGKELMMKFK